MLHQNQEKNTPYTVYEVLYMVLSTCVNKRLINAVSHAHALARKAIEVVDFTVYIESAHENFECILAAIAIKSFSNKI